MKNFIKRYSVRNRVIFTTLLTGLIYLLLVTPIVEWIVDYTNQPANVANLQIDQTQIPNQENPGVFDQNVSLTWEVPDRLNLNQIIVSLGESTRVLLNDDTGVSIPVSEYPNNLEVYTEGILGRASNSYVVELLELPADQGIRSIVLEESVRDAEVGALEIDFFLAGFLLSILIFFSTLIIFNFNIGEIRRLVIALFPAIAILPVTIISISFVQELNSDYSRFALSIVVTLIFSLLVYFLQITSNILNTGFDLNIPIEQAARASQFIFSLISAYIALVIFFGANYNFIEKLLLIGGFFFYFALSCIVALDKVSIQSSFAKAFGILTPILFLIFVLSIWPINYIYGILSIAIVFYILLSTALEVRGSKLTNYVAFEYLGLILIVTFVLIATAEWGILGTLI